MVSPRFCNYELLPHLATVRLCIASYSLHIGVYLAKIQGKSLPEPLEICWMLRLDRIGSSLGAQCASILS